MSTQINNDAKNLWPQGLDKARLVLPPQPELTDEEKAEMEHLSKEVKERMKNTPNPEWISGEEVMRSLKEQLRQTES